MKRDGEVELARDPADDATDAGIAFVGRVRSPWTDRSECPKNMAAARESGKQAYVELAQTYRPGLQGLAAFSHIVILTWLDRSQRNLIVQAPRHAPEPRGVFALRSPARPNPIGMHVAKIMSVDETTGIVGIDAIDVLDGTPVIDLKPYFASIDAFPEATRPADRRRP